MFSTAHMYICLNGGIMAQVILTIKATQVLSWCKVIIILHSVAVIFFSDYKYLYICNCV